MIPLAEGHNTSFFSAHNYTQAAKPLTAQGTHEALTVTLTACHMRATEAYKNGMVHLFTREI